MAIFRGGAHTAEEKVDGRTATGFHLHRDGGQRRSADRGI